MSAYSILLAVTYRGQRLHVVARDDLDTRMTSLASRDDGGIAAFSSEDGARAWAAGRFPLPPDDEHQTPMLIAGMQELYAEAGTAVYDLDVAARWAAAPSPSAAEPGQLLEAWVFLYWAGTAPPADLSDMAGVPMARELAGLAYVLSGLQRDFERRGQANGQTTAWPAEHAVVWPAEADEMIASLLKTGLQDFGEKLRVS